MALDQNQNQGAASDTQQPSTLAELNEERIKAKIKLGKEMAAQQQAEQTKQKQAPLAPGVETPKGEGPIPAPRVEIAPAPEGQSAPVAPPVPEAAPTPQAAVEDPTITAQREKAQAALADQAKLAAALQATRAEAQKTSEEAGKLSSKIETQSDLAATRAEAGKPQAGEAASRAVSASQKVEEAARELKGLAQEAKAEAKQEAVATKTAQGEVKKLENLKAASPTQQKETLQKAREEASKQ